MKSSLSSELGLGKKEECEPSAFHLKGIRKHKLGWEGMEALGHCTCRLVFAQSHTLGLPVAGLVEHCQLVLFQLLRQADIIKIVIGIDRCP
jgi:hypothetical protein